MCEYMMRIMFYLDTLHKYDIQLISVLECTVSELFTFYL